MYMSKREEEDIYKKKRRGETRLIGLQTTAGM